jgi:drug/metabolite transporter (DMT)-like permease
MFFAAAASVANVFADVFRKKAIARNDLWATTFWVRAIAGLLFVAVLIWHVLKTGPIRIADGEMLVFGPVAFHLPGIALYLCYLLLDTGLVAVSILMYFRALQVSDLSLSIPFLSFTPAMLLVTGAVFLHEFPPAQKLVGVVLVVVGSLLMNCSAFRDGLLGPFKALIAEKGCRYMLGVATLLSITNPLDKKLVMMSDAFTYAAAYGAMLFLLLGAIVVWKKPGWTASFQQAPLWIVLAGVFDGSTLLLQFLSHRYVEVVITITVKRTGVILSVLAGWIIFREKKIGERLLASAVMFSGVLVIYLPFEMKQALLLAATMLCGVFLMLRYQRTA